MSTKFRIPGRESGIEVQIERHAWQKMYGWCKAAQSECGGMGMAILNGNVFQVYEVFFPKQYCSGAYTECDDEALGKLNYKLYKFGRYPERLRFWWHTHYNFATFWSGTDDENANRLADANGEWELSLVINQKDDYRCRIDMRKPLNLIIDEVPVRIIPNERRIKRKRNYKSDVKKWIHGMDEMPESQKPKFSRQPEIESDNIVDIETSSMPWWRMNSEKPAWMRNWKSKAILDESPLKNKNSCDCGRHDCDQSNCNPCLGKCGKRLQGSIQRYCKSCSVESQKLPEEKNATLGNTHILHNGELTQAMDEGIKCGGMMLYKGLLMSHSRYEQIRSEEAAVTTKEPDTGTLFINPECHCKHTSTSWEECECIKDCDYCLENLGQIIYGGM